MAYWASEVRRPNSTYYDTVYTLGGAALVEAREQAGEVAGGLVGGPALGAVAAVAVDPGAHLGVGGVERGGRDVRDPARPGAGRRGARQPLGQAALARPPTSQDQDLLAHPRLAPDAPDPWRARRKKTRCHRYRRPRACRLNRNDRMFRSGGLLRPRRA
jgi:hypothetical protein